MLENQFRKSPGEGDIGAAIDLGSPMRSGYFVARTPALYLQEKKALKPPGFHF